MYKNTNRGTIFVNWGLSKVNVSVTTNSWPLFDAIDLIRISPIHCYQSMYLLRNNLWLFDQNLNIHQLVRSHCCMACSCDKLVEVTISIFFKCRSYAYYCVWMFFNLCTETRITKRKYVHLGDGEYGQCDFWKELLIYFLFLLAKGQNIDNHNLCRLRRHWERCGQTHSGQNTTTF